MIGGLPSRDNADAASDAAQMHAKNGTHGNTQTGKEKQEEQKEKDHVRMNYPRLKTRLM